jgi:hypothetical protein
VDVAAGAQLSAVGVVVMAPVGEQLPGAPARPATPPADRRHRIQERNELGDVVAVAAGQRDRQRNATGVADQMVLGTGTRAVDRRRADVVPPFERAHARPVDGAAVQVQPVAGAQLGEQQLVQGRATRRPRSSRAAAASR